MESFSCIGIPEKWFELYEGTLISSDNPNMTLRYSNYFSYVSVAAVKAIKVRLSLREALRSLYRLLLDNKFKL